MTNSEVYRKAVTLIEQSKNILITTHIRPDGDACGCVRAMLEALNSLGKTVRTAVYVTSGKLVPGAF